MPRGTRKTYIKKKNTRNKKNIRKQRRTRGRGGMKRHLEVSLTSIPEHSLPEEHRNKRSRLETDDEDEEEKQLTDIQSKAIANDAEAQSQLGTVYFYGLLGMKQSDENAMQWFEMAANQGHANAQYNLGMMYKNSQGVKQSDDNAMHWFEMAANQGHANAQYNLGVMHSRDQGVDRYSEAMKWYAMAAEQGHACACDALTRTRILDEILKDKILKSKVKIERKKCIAISGKNFCTMMGGKKTAKRRHKRRRKTSTRRRR